MDDGVGERAPGRQEKSAREATNEDSRGSAAIFADFRAAIGRAGGPLLAVSALGALAALLMLVAELSTIASVEIGGLGESCEVQLIDPEQRDRCALSGLDQHGGALILVALLTLVMAWGAGIGESRPAAGALVAIGAIVLFVALVIDLPDTNETGAIGPNFEGATGSAGFGFYAEIVAGVLALAAGGIRLSRRA
jgi:hypothetical protein